MTSRLLLLRAGMAALAALLAGAPLRAQTPAAPGTPLPADSAVRTGTLPNGLRYYVRANAEPDNRAELRLVVDAGSVLEDDDQRGVAHLLEHMAFNGTRNFEKQALVDYLERVGMRFGPDINAYTSFDETVYMLKLPTDSAGVLETGFRILRDWAGDITLDPAEIEKERGVVIEEWRQGRGAGARVRDQQLPKIFHGSRYAERLPIGSRESLLAVTPDAVRRFYQDWYRPDLMAVVAVGDFDPARVERLVREHFAGLPKPPTTRPRPSFSVPGHAEPLVARATDREQTTTTVAVLYKQPPQPQGTVGDYRREMVERLYNGMLNERFQELAQQPNPPFLGAYSGQGRFLRGAAVYQLAAAVGADAITRGLEALLTEAERVARHGFTATELERQKADLLRAMERAYAERAKTESEAYASEYVDHFLSESPYPGIAAEYALHQRLVPGIGLDEVNRLAREWLTDENRVVVVSAPDKPDVRVPSDTALLAVFGAVEASPIAAYVDQTSDEPLLERPDRAGRVVAEREIPEIGVREWRLSNGARVVIKPTDFKDDEILFAASSPGGASLFSAQEQVPATTAALVASMGGVGRLSEIELRKRLAGKAVQVAPYVGMMEEGMSGSASPRDLETLLQLVHLYFTAPRRDSAAFASMVQKQRQALEFAGSSPDKAFADTLMVTLAQHHPRARPVTVRTVEEMDLDRSLAIYRDRFADAGDFSFYFVGNVDPAQLRPLVESYLATLPATGRKEAAKDVGLTPPRGVVRREVRRGVEPRARTQIVFTGPIRYTREELYAMRALTELLRIRLREELREEQSGTYGVSVSSSASSRPRPEYRVTIGFGSAPERVEELTGRVFAQLDSVRRVAPGAEEIAKIQELHRRAREEGLRQNGYWLGALSSFEERGWELRTIPADAELIARLGPDMIRDAARRLLDARNYVQVTLLPETTAAPAPKP